MMEAASGRTFGTEEQASNPTFTPTTWQEEAAVDVVIEPEDDKCHHVLAAVRSIIIGRRGRSLDVDLGDLRRFLGETTRDLLQHLEHLRASGHIIVRPVDDVAAAAAHESVRRAACRITLPEFADDMPSKATGPTAKGPARVFDFARPMNVTRTRRTGSARTKRAPATTGEGRNPPKGKE